MRHFRAAARAALVQLQFSVWSVPGVQRPRLEIRFRSVESHCRLDAASFRRRTWSRFGFGFFETQFGAGRDGAWIRPRDPIRKIAAPHAEPDPLRQSTLE